jgi:signal transduction histidine kinase/CheY-like chemotaxis protein
MNLSQPRQRALRPMGLRGRLAALVLVTAVPLIAFAIGLVLWHSRTEQDLLRQQSSRTATAAMQSIDRELSGAIAGLQVLAASPSLAAGDFRSFHAQAKAAEGIAGNSVVILYDAQGTRIVSTAAGYGTALPRRADMSAIAAPFATGKPHVSPLFGSYTVRRPTVGIIVPVFVAGDVRYVLGAGLLSSRISELVANSGVPSEWVAAVLDQEGTIIARTRAAERFVGTKALPDVWRRMQAQAAATGSIEGDTKDGAPAMLAFARSGQSGWTTVVAIPTATLTGQLRRSLSLVATAAAAVLLLAAALIWWGLKQITRPLDRLVHMARALEDGQATEAGATGIEQFDRLADTLAQAGRVIRDRHQELRHEHDQKDRFIATLAHELRNPLAPIRTGLHILARHPAPALADRTLATMQRQLSHMVRLIDDLLDVSRVARGTLVLRQEQADLATIIGDAVASAEPYISGGGQRLVLELPPGPIPVNVDEARTCQILVNLLQNASKFTAPGGLIRIGLESTADAYEVTVTDTGRGIAAEELEKIFELFYQVRNEADGSTPGLGIGLSLSQRLAELHGGALRVHSEGRGRGAAFTLRLPRPAAPLPQEAIPLDGGGSQRAALRILVVDDNVDAADALAAGLQLDGHTVHVAHDGASAIELAGEVTVDVVLLDIGMPGMNGYEVCRRLRELAGYRAVRIVALTGWGTARDRQLAADAGFDAHVTKPAEWSQIQEALGASDDVLRAAPA